MGIMYQVLIKTFLNINNFYEILFKKNKKIEFLNILKV